VAESRGARGPHALAGERKELRREEILDTAARLFSERGYEATSMSDLAEELGVTKPAIYYYISNKDELLSALFDRSLSQLERNLDSARDATLDPIERLRLVVRGHVAEAAHENRALLVFVRAGNHGSSHAGLAPADRARAAHYTRGIAGLVDQGKAAGLLRPDLDSRLVAFAVIGMCNWVATWYDPKGSAGPEDVADQFASIVLDSIRA
jgi:TetR/AcrR family transcriptional regulator, cholesterol catabolism regulator